MRRSDEEEDEDEDGSFTLPFSTSRVSITTTQDFNSHTIRQNSGIVLVRGPCVAMYSWSVLANSP